MLNETLLMPGGGSTACVATAAWNNKPQDKTWDFDVRLLPGGSCSTSDIMVAYARARPYSSRYSIDEWRAGSCEYETGSGTYTLNRVELQNRLDGSRGSNYDGSCGKPDSSDHYCHGFIGSLADFSAVHEGGQDRFHCEDDSYMTLYAVSSCAGALAVSVYEKPSEASLAFCEAYAARANAMVFAIVASLVVLAVGAGCCGLWYPTDTRVGRRLRDAERSCCAALTCGYLGGLAMCRRHCEPKREEDLRDLRDCECIGCEPPPPRARGNDSAPAPAGAKQLEPAVAPAPEAQERSA